MTLAIDRAELDRFVGACFCKADLDTFASMRAFFDHKDGAALFEEWQTIRINGNSEDIVDAAEGLAKLAAFDDEAIVFAPPICTFNNPDKADVASLANGLVITAELDTDPAAGRAKLEAILGSPTIAIESGGLWLDPATAEWIPKLHLHWRLSVPTRTKIEHDFLREANRRATAIAGGDPSAIALVHPLRWAGSWHRKAEPRLARIIAYNPEVELSLAEALNKLRAAGNGHDRTAGGYTSPTGHQPSSFGPAADALDITAALAIIPNDEKGRKRWSDIGMACWRASDGSEAGLAAFAAWTSKYKGNSSAVEKARERWEHWAKFPPTAIGAGTLFHLAREAWPGWERPSDAQRRRDNDPGEPPPHVVEPPADDGGLAEGLPELGEGPKDDANGSELTKEQIEEHRAQIEHQMEKTLAELNRHFAVVNEAGKCLIFKRTRDPAFDGRDVLDRLSFDDFARMYSNRWIEVTTRKVTKGGGVEDAIIKRKLATWWLSHPQRRQYLGGVTFDPTNRAPANFLNLWRGFSVKPAAGSWSLMKEHIFTVICRGEPADGEYVLNWLARLVQYPEKPGEVALVIRSTEKGTGKSLFGRYIVRLFGHHGMHITHAPHLTGRFNAHLHDCCILFADEAFFVGDKTHEGALKGLITEHTLTIEGKGSNIITVRNRLHILIASNKDWVIPASVDERRFAVFEATDTHRGYRAYFAALVAQMNNGGLAAMLDELQHRDISGFEVRDVPKTEALQAQKALSLPSLERWWLTVLERGFLWKSRHGAPWFLDWHDFYTTELLMRSYVQWCDETRPYDRKTREQLGAFFSPLYSISRPRGEHPVYEIDSIDRHAVEVIALSNGGVQTVPKDLDEIAIASKSHSMGYHVGELDEARARFLELLGDIPSPWT